MEKKRWIDKDGNFWDGISIVLNGMRIWNPTDEQLIEAGYTEWVEPTPPEPTPEELLERAKQEKLMEIEDYDRSNAVNQFFLGEYPLWLDFDERERLKAQIESRLRLGYQTMTKTYEGLPAVTFPLSAWQVMSDQLEAYAGDCQEVTSGHKAAINNLLTVQEVEAYDHTSGYPEKLVFELPVPNVSEE